MTAKVCKKCPSFVIGKSWCTRKGVYRSPWDDFCAERTADWEAWRLDDGGVQ